jgi:hypothetical protein
MFALGFIGHIAYARARIRGLAILMVLFNVFNVLLTLYLVGVLHMGALGSAIGTCVTRILAPIFCWPLAVRLTGVVFRQWFEEAGLPGLTPALVGAAGCLAMRFFVEPVSWLGVSTCIAAGSACYLAALVGLSIRPEDRLLLDSSIRKFRGLIPLMSPF